MEIVNEKDNKIFTFIGILTSAETKKRICSIEDFFTHLYWILFAKGIYDELKH